VLVEVLKQAPLQAVVPPEQTSEHVPSTQVFPVVVQSVPQEPQFFESFLTSLQTAGVPHAAKPVAQVATQEPALQTLPDPQTTPHAPQLLMSVVRSRHVAGDPHGEVPVAQDGRHAVTPPTVVHTLPEEHALPHAPQLFGSVNRSRQLAGEPQAERPLPQEIVHAPSTHAWPEEQALPHVPQLFGSGLVSRHEPLHAVVPATQLNLQMEPAQISPSAHANGVLEVVHPPQFRRSVAVSTHLPPQRVVGEAHVPVQVPALQT